MKRLIGVLFFLASAPSFGARAIPALTSPVLDEAQLLSSRERSQLEEVIRSAVTSVQLQVWTIPSLEGESIEGLSIRAVDQWKLGSEKKDNGVLILVARDERSVRVEVGQGLEGMIPDVIAGRIVDRMIVPQFKQGKYFQGLLLGVRVMIERSGGNLTDSAKLPLTKRAKPFTHFLLLIVFIVLIRTLSRFQRIGSYSIPARRGRWSTGGGFGSFGGGGGWSGGGGGFSGGGASGRW